MLVTAHGTVFVVNGTDEANANDNGGAFASIGWASVTLTIRPESLCAVT